jgi:hypothetical protein
MATPPYSKALHDIGITNVGTGGSGTAVIGMMLAQRQGQPQYQEFDNPLLADQFFTGAPQQTYINPEKELPIGQSDWRAGFGLEVASSSDPFRYFDSLGIDARFKGQIIAGPAAAAITLPDHSGGISNYTHLTNRGFETGAITGWTNEGNGTSAISTANPDAGTYHLRQAGLSDGQTARATFQITFDSSFQGKSFTFTAQAHPQDTGDAVVQCRVSIADGQGTTNGSWRTTGSYGTVTVTRTLDGSADKLELQIETTFTENEGGFTAGDFDTLTLTHPVITGAVKVFIEYNSELYIARGGDIEKLNAGGTAFTSVKSDFDAVITDLAVFSDDQLYIALGQSSEYWQMNTSEAFTENNLTVNMFKYFAFVNTTADTMYGSDSDNTIRSTTNPANGGTQWSAQTTVGAASEAITKLMEKSGALYVMKTDQPYYLDSSGNVQKDLAPELATETRSTDNGKNSFLWLNKLYMPYGTETILETDGTTNAYRNIASYATNLPTSTGQVNAIAGDSQYLFAIVDTGSTAYIYSGRPETIGSTTAWAWHPISSKSMAGCETAYVSGVVKKRLWFSSTTASEGASYLPLPAGYGDITGDTDMVFAVSGVTFTTSWYHANFPLTTKAWIKIQATLGHSFDTDIFFNVDYQKLGDASWTDIGNLKGTSTDRAPELFIPVDASSNKPVSPMMRFRFTVSSDDSSKTPRLLSYNIQTVLYPTRKSIIAARIRSAEELTNKQGRNMTNSYDIVNTTLDNARDATWPVSIRDIDGTTQTVKFLPLSEGTPRYEIIRDDKGREQERHYNVLMQVVPLS